MNQILFSKNKKTIDVTPTQLTIYKQSKIVELMDKEKNHYYLFFFKDEFINGLQANEIKIDSYLHKAFNKGFNYNGNHPLTNIVLSNKKTYTNHRFNQLYTKVKQNHSLIEAAYIFTFFDSFIPKSEIVKLLKSVYYHYRRNGQLNNAFKTIKVYEISMPNDHFAKEMLNNIQFQPYEILYQDIKSLTSKDNIYIESYCYDHLTNSNITFLTGILKKQNRWIDVLTLQMYQLARAGAPSTFYEIKTIMEEHLTYDQQVLLLLDLLPQFKHTLQEVQQHLFEILIQQKGYNQLIELVVTEELSTTPKQLKFISHSFEQADSHLFPSLFSQLNHKLLSLYKHDPKTLEKVTHRCVKSFLPYYSIGKIIEWISPIKEAGLSLPIEKKLIKMEKLENDPDGQFILGELYLNFDLLDKSIDCFKWEMELHPEDPKPLQLLTKVLKQMGNTEEANAYHHLLLQLQKSS